MARLAAVSTLVLAACACACTGELDEARPIEVGPAPMRRIARFEYDQAVHDLLGDTTHPGLGFAPEAEALGFDNQSGNQSVTTSDADAYMQAAESLAATAVGDLPRLLPCDPAPDEDACARAFIDHFVARAYRRSLEADEKVKLFGLFDEGRKVAGFARGIAYVIEATLQSPHFLYRIEHGFDDASHPGVIPLTSYEVAARLSFLLWSSVPDDALMQAADRGELLSQEGIGRQASRMLRDPRAHIAIRHFHEQWLGLRALDNLSKDPTSFPSFNAELRPMWKEETLSFLDRVVFSGGGGLEAMLTSPFTMVNHDLGRFYGIADAPEGDDFERRELDPARYAGFLTQPGILAINAKTNQSSPVLRGKLVRERLLCQTMPSPPANMPIVSPPLRPDTTTRERFDAHRTDPACAGCHQMLDPVGYAFEHFDGIGMWRDEEQGIAIDATGELVQTADADGAFDGAVELAHRLANSDQVRNCVVRQWFRYGFGRAEQPDDAATLADLERSFASTGYSVRGLLLAIAQSDAFRYRRADDGLD